ncbi:hypothetical protein O9992_19170 [Vibrio lentus]|nr:hypothetical protein [Vibrio lentus]
MQKHYRKGNGYELVKFFFLMTFAAAIPAIVSGGIAERARFYPILIATLFTVDSSTRFLKASSGTVILVSLRLEGQFGHGFHTAGSVVVHGVGGWIGSFVAVYFLACVKRRIRAGKHYPPRTIEHPILKAPGSLSLCVGWFGFNADVCLPPRHQ